MDQDCKVLKLTENMRLKSHKSMQTVTEIKEFDDWILHIGDGDMEISKDILILHVEQPLL